MKIKTKLLTLFVICWSLLSLSCNSTHNKNDFNSVLSEILFEEDDSNKKLCLILFVSNEHMCSECLSKEILNIKNDPWVEENIIIMGVSSNKREFLSNFSSINPRKTIVVKNDNNKHIFANQMMQYFLFDREKKRIFHFFHPQPCDMSKTHEYFKSAKKLIEL